MSETLIAENRQLREKLDSLIEHARRNEEIMRRHQAFDLAFISAESFSELITSIFQTLTKSSGLDVTTLLLIDADYEIRRILIDLRIDLGAFPNLIFLQDESELGDLEGHLDQPVLGPYTVQEHGAAFPEPFAIPASVAILPLRRKHRLLGCLNLGSFDASRFAQNMATDFIEHLASTVAICVENSINNERLKHIGVTDPLTGVNNRRYVDRRLLEEVGRTARHGNALSCLYIDIDHFKQINDKVGHQGGDDVLREVAMRIKAELRLSDALARFGGEEFVVLLVDADIEDAAIVAERIRAGVADLPVPIYTGEEVSVAVSIGVATLDADNSTETAEVIVQKFVWRADQALYQAKTGGRNRVVRADHSAAARLAPGSNP
ncbi:sensor domain-containing diguanylate cyclase [soil metagenome]